jgi:quinolinate synthase
MTTFATTDSMVDELLSADGSRGAVVITYFDTALQSTRTVVRVYNTATGANTLAVLETDYAKVAFVPDGTLRASVQTTSGIRISTLNV